MVKLFYEGEFLNRTIIKTMNGYMETCRYENCSVTKVYRSNFAAYMYIDMKLQSMNVPKGLRKNMLRTMLPAFYLYEECCIPNLDPLIGIDTRSVERRFRN